MKSAMAIALLFAVGTTATAAENLSKRFVDPEYLHSLLQEKLNSGVAFTGHGGIVIDVHHPNEPISIGWHYLDALYCGWDSNNGAPLFYVYDGKTVLWDTTSDLFLASALAIPCGHGNKLGYYVSGKPSTFIYNKVESFTYP